MQKSRRQPQSSVTVRRFHKRKSCCHVIAIPRAGIATPTLTVMQGFQAKKKDCFVHFLSWFLGTSSILCISGGSRKFWWGMIKILSTKPQKFGCVVTRRVARNSQWSGYFRGLGAKPPALKNFAFFCKNNLILQLV